MDERGVVGYAAGIAELERIAARRAADEARQIEILASLATDTPPWLDPERESEAVAKQWVREEISCALRIPSVTVAAMLAEAGYVRDSLPDTLRALKAGEVSRLHVRVLVDAVSGLDPAVASAVEARVLPGACTQTVTNFRRSIRRAIAALDTASERDRHEREYEKRRVAISHGDDGMSTIWAYLPSDGAQAIYDAIQAMAVGAATDPTDVRTADQRRADALMSLACTPAGEAPRASVHVTVSLATLLGGDETPAELAGVGPISAEHARQIAFREGSVWRRLVTDPFGRLVELSSQRYRPPKRLREHVETRDQTCRFPHCNRRAVRCEVDHCDPRSRGGPTCEGNLHPLCKRHHHLKHEAGWRVGILDDGTTRWTSPTGHVYDVPPYCHPVDPALGMTEGNVVCDQSEADAA